MTNLNNPGNHNDISLDCNDRSPLSGDLNIDSPPPFCGDDGTPSQKRVIGSQLPDVGWDDCDANNEKTGIGHEANCDPMQSGKIISDTEKPNRNVVYRYSKAMRGCDEAMKELFSNIDVIDEDGKASRVPIIWGTQERAVAAILQDNVRKDNTLVIDKVRLPMMSIYSSDLSFDKKRYIYHRAKYYARRPDGKPAFTTNEKYQRDTVFGIAAGIPIDIGYNLYIWTLYIEDMNQIVEQIMTKFSHMAYIRVRGVPWEIGVELNSIANNIDMEPGEKMRVVKYQFNFVAHTYIPQPIVRNKAVLKIQTDFFNNVDEKRMDEVIDRLVEAVEELE